MTPIPADIEAVARAMRDTQAAAEYRRDEQAKRLRDIALARGWSALDAG